MKTSADIKALRSELAKVAQKIYDDWDESDEDTYAGGGICHLIAEDMAGVLNDHGIDAQTVSSSSEVHVYVVAAVKDGVFVVDIPYGIYERGGGYSWHKLPDVTFEPGDISISRVDSDPGEVGKYLDECAGPKSFLTFLTEAEKAKVSKATAHYDDQTAVNFPTKRCELCTMFRLHPPDFESGACTAVDGLISANGLCDYYKRDPKAPDLAEGVRGTRG